MTTLRSVQAHELHGGRRSRGASWSTIQVQAWCQCGWASAWRSWTNGTTATNVADAVRADLDDHQAASGHTPVPSGCPGPAGYHQRCGWFHTFDDACPAPPDSTAGRIQRVAQATINNPARALDRLAAINELRAWLDDQEAQAVIGARMARCTWQDIAGAFGITRHAARDRWEPQIKRYEAVGLLDPDASQPPPLPVITTVAAPEP
jgi:hypothetical protein